MVNQSGKTVSNDDIICFLKEQIKYKEMCQKILSQRAIDRAVRERKISVTPEEIQAEADRHRLARRLEKASDTLAWLTDEMITPDDWEAGIKQHLLAKKLADALFSSEVEKYFAQHKLEYEKVLLYQIVVPYERLAREIFYQIEEEEISFYHAAHLYDIEPKRRELCGYEGKLNRSHLKADIAALVFGATPGQIIGPHKSDLGYHLFKVEEFISAELTEERSQQILNKLFQEWLASEVNYLLHNAPC
ncbi:peptidylprolyl isomerase [Capilliphycus salinus ALCB114379]|uniref:peptidylprolyl isomerase n=1 Tax=Capilliphycus salinus TaxID=2768948 RepID=UPI0039A4FEA1